MMNWPTSMRASSSSKLKWTQYILPSCFAKDDSKPLGCPSSWRTWNAWHQSLCAMRGAMTGPKSLSKGVGSVKHKVVLS